MTAVLGPDAMARYRRAALAREGRLQQDAEERRQAAWDVALRAARLLYETYGATKVVVFGSLAHGVWFGLRSDIDLAVEGIPPETFWSAWCALDRLDPAIDIDLVAIESASGRLRDEIKLQGVAL